MIEYLRRFWIRSAIALSVGLGLGLLPGIPGTFGTLLGLPLVWGLQQLPWWGNLAATLLVIALGVPICQAGSVHFGRKDPGQVVFDEIAAFPLVYLFVPFDPSSAILGFVLFRLFDMTKPWPIRRLERLPGGVGVMADDLAAALLAAVVLVITRPMV